MLLYLTSILLLWITLSSVIQAKQAVPSIAIPRGKNRKNVAIGFGQGIVNKLFREIKISFCSELEALTLQLTRPTDIALAASSLDEIIKFLDDEYENTSLLTSVLVKLSRKFMEPNSYTKLKAMLIVHKMLLSISKEKKSFKIVQALEALRKETDEKFDIPFFSAESLENVVGSADTVAEATAVDLAIAYSKYVLDFIDYKAYMRSFSTTTTTTTAASSEGDVVAMEATAKLLCNQIQRGIEVKEACENCDRSSELAKQCREAQEADRDILKIEMKALYEKMVRFSGVGSKAKLSPSSIKDIEAVLKIVDPNFTPLEQHVTSTATTTATVTSKPSPAGSVEAPLSTERKPQQWVVEEKATAATTTTTTTTMKKEKQVEVSTADNSKNVDSKYSGAGAVAAVQSSDEKGRASEIARELAQRSVSRSSSSSSSSYNNSNGKGIGSSSAAIASAKTASVSLPPKDTVSIGAAPAARSKPIMKVEESAVTPSPKPKTKKSTKKDTQAPSTKVDEKKPSSTKDSKLSAAKSRTIGSSKADTLGLGKTSSNETSKTGIDSTKKKGNKNK